MTSSRRHPLLALICTLAAALATTVAAPAHAAGPRITAPSAIVVDARSGDAAYAKQADQRRPIASTTKLMTALLVLENAKLTDVYVAPRYRGLPAESKINLRPGERLTVADLLRGLLVYSANDAAETLAENMSGSRASFVRQMNRRAVELGLTNTHYANPIGLDEPGNYSSARDLTKLVIALRRFAFFRQTVDSPVVTLRSGARPRTLSNRNLLVRRFNWIDGVKTGHTLQAGYVLVASGSRRGVPLISVALGTPSEDARDTDSLSLLQYGFEHFRRRLVIRRGQVLAHVPIKYRPGATLDLVAKRSVRRVVPRGPRGHVDRVLKDVPDEVEGPLHRGDRIAAVELRLRGRRLTTVSLVAGSDIEATSATRRVQDWLTGPWTLGIIALVLLVAVLVTRMRRTPRESRQHRTPPQELPQ